MCSLGRDVVLRCSRRLAQPGDSVRERDRGISLGTYTAAVQVDVRLDRAGNIVLSNWRAQFVDYYDFNIGAAALISFPASAISRVERVAINAILRSAIPGSRGLIHQRIGGTTAGYSVTLPDAYFAALAASGMAHNYAVRSPVFSPQSVRGINVRSRDR